METAHYVAGDKEEKEQGCEGCCLSGGEREGPGFRAHFPSQASSRCLAAMRF